jgi:hypothetical protein
MKVARHCQELTSLRIQFNSNPATMAIGTSAGHGRSRRIRAVTPYPAPTQAVMPERGTSKPTTKEGFSTSRQDNTPGGYPYSGGHWIQKAVAQ